jgi:hypothetical protein
MSGRLGVQNVRNGGDDKDTAKSGEVLIERVSLAVQFKSLTPSSDMIKCIKSMQNRRYC